MKSCTYRVSLAMTALALIGLARPVGAQQPPANLVPFKATFSPVEQRFPLPLTPPVVSVESTGTGQADLLGQITVTGHYLLHLGVDGKPLFISDGVVVFTAANGDALFHSFVGIFQGPGAWVVTGGTGRYAGATGSGAFTGAVDSTGKLTVTHTGFISAPKP